MTKVKNCLCGGIGIIFSETDEPPYMVYCSKCGKESLQWAKKEEAIKNWNKINEQM